ncbi:MAG: ABC transporter permease [Vicinamibacteria bacterium]
MESLFRDFSLAFKALKRRIGFSTLVIGILALSIGATSAIFTVFEALLLRPLPFTEPDRLVMVWENNTVRSHDRNSVGPANFMQWRDRAKSFSGLAAFSSFSTTLSGTGEPERLDAGASSGNLFTVLGVPPLLGRTLVEDDSKPGAPNVAVLSEGLWRRRFGADPSVVGRVVTLNAAPATIVGVVGESFKLVPAAELWVPFEVSESMRTARGRWMTVAARLAPGVTVAQAKEEMTHLEAQLEQENRDLNAGWTASVYPFQSDMVRNVRPALLVLMGAVVLMLMVACANVANLLLVRALSRERDLAVQKALGASPLRIARQLFAESLLIAGAGAVGGLAFASGLLRLMLPMMPPEARLVSDFGLNPRVVGFALLASVLSALFFGVVPALQQSQPSLAPSLKEGAARGASRGKRRVKNMLVIAEIALSLILTAGTGVLLRSFWRLIHVDTGFQTDGVLSAQVNLPSARYRDGVKQSAFFDEVVRRIAGSPGVESAAAISWAPLGTGSATDFRVLDREEPAPGKAPVADVRMVTPNLFSTMGTPLLSGRDFTVHDSAGHPVVVVVNKALADEFWPGQSPLGKRIAMEWGRTLDAEIIGVVADVHLASLGEPARSTLYWSVDQLPNSFMTLMVKSAGRPEAVAASLREGVASLDSELAVSRMRPLSEIVAQSVSRERFLVGLLGVFALLAVLLSGAGVYGVLAYTVMDRVPEMGVRLAVGARPLDLIRLIVSEGLALGVAGVGMGLLAAFAGTRVLDGLLFEVKATDPVALSAVSVLLLSVTALAALIPALRASRTDPLRALRAE